MRKFFSDIPLVLFAVFGIAWLGWGFWFYGSMISIPFVLVSALVTLVLPIGMVFSGRFRLWHIFVWMTMFGVVLAWFSQR